MQTIEDRVRAAVREMVPQPASQPSAPEPDHEQLGGVKWLVGPLPEATAAAFEGGYQCRCGEVFARTVEQGGIAAANLALLAHLG